MKHVIGVVLLALLLSLPASGEEAALSEEIRDWLQAFKKEVLEEVEALKKRSDRRSVLDRTLRLSFKLVPEEDKEHVQSVSVTTPEYGIGAQMTSNGTRFAFHVEGKISPVEAKPNTILLTFLTVLEFRRKENSGEVSANGSSLVPIGMPTTLAELGEKSLVVTVTEVK